MNTHLMIIFSYPEILLQLYEFKMSTTGEIPKNLIALLLNNSTSVDLNFFSDLLFNNNVFYYEIEQRKQLISSIIDETMVAVSYTNNATFINLHTFSEFNEKRKKDELWILEMKNKSENVQMNDEFEIKREKMIKTFFKNLNKKKSLISNCVDYEKSVEIKRLEFIELNKNNQYSDLILKNQDRNAIEERKNNLNKKEAASSKTTKVKRNSKKRKIVPNEKDSIENKENQENFKSITPKSKIIKSENTNKKKTVTPKSKNDIIEKIENIGSGTQEIKPVKDEKIVKKIPVVPKSTPKKDKKPAIFMNLTKIFNIKKIERIAEPEKDVNLRFQPLLKKYDYKFEYRNKKFMKNFTVRKKKKLLNPVKLTFIKFHDQIKPPFYGIVQKSKSRISHKKISLVKDYDKDSDEDWILEEGENIESSEVESEESEEEIDNDFIENDGSTVFEKRVYKKPEIDFTPIKYNFFTEFDDKWFDIPILKRNHLPDDLKNIFIEEYNKRKTNEEFCKDFGLKYRILNSVILKEIKHLKEKGVTAT